MSIFSGIKYQYKYIIPAQVMRWCMLSINYCSSNLFFIVILTWASSTLCSDCYAYVFPLHYFANSLVISIFFTITFNRLNTINFCLLGSILFALTDYILVAISYSKYYVFDFYIRTEVIILMPQMNLIFEYLRYFCTKTAPIRVNWTICLV